MTPCDSCSAPLPEGARFCPSCGTPVPVVAPLPEAPVATAPPAAAPTFGPAPLPQPTPPPSNRRVIWILVAAVTAFVLIVAIAGGGMFWWFLQRSQSPQAIAKQFWLAPCDGYMKYVYVDDSNRDNWSGSETTCTQTGYQSPQVQSVSAQLATWTFGSGICDLDPPSGVQASGALRIHATWNDSGGAETFDGYTCMVEVSDKWYVYAFGLPPSG